MNISKYRNLLIIYAIFMVCVAIILLIFGELQPGLNRPLLNFLPMNLAGTSLFLLMMVGVASIIGGVLMGFVFGPMFLYSHKKIIGNKMIYGLQDRPQQAKLKGIFLKLLFPALLTVNFCLMFYDNSIIKQILIPPDLLAGIGDQSMISFVGLMPLMAGISIGIFSPVWFLLNGGIVFTNKDKAKDSSDPIEIRSVGGWYMYLLKGYAGISVILNYYQFLTNMITHQQASSLIVYLFWPIMPFLIAILIIPCVIALDITFEKRRKFILK